MEPIIGKHYAPSASIQSTRVSAVPTFFATSVGVSLVLPKSGRGWKLSKAKVRVTGENTEDGIKEINALAERIAKLLDEGRYDGPKTITVGSKAAQKIMEDLA